MAKERWTQIEVEQSEDERLRRFVFIVRVDGEEVAKAINNKPSSFSKVNIVKQIEKLYHDPLFDWVFQFG